MKIKFSLSTGSLLWSHSLEDNLRIASELGFDAVEPWADRPHAWPRDFMGNEQKLKRLFEFYNLECSSLCPFFLHDLNLGNPNPGVRKEGIKQVKETIDLASALEAKIVLIIPGHNWLPGILHPEEKVWEPSVESIKECADYAGDRRVKLGIENITGTKLVETSDHMLRMLKEVNSENVGFIPDVSNIVPLEKPVEFLNKLGKDILMVHVADNDLKIPKHLPIGMGEINFKAIMQVLKANDFNGYMTLEIFYPEDPVGGARQSIESLKAIENSI